MAIDIKSLNQLLGDMLRKIKAETPLNDISAGSALLSLLEAAASNDYENNVAILNVLELLNIDVVRNNDLDARAGDFGLKRNAAVKASGLVTIKNTNITKRSTGLYVIKPAPIAGQTTIYVNNTSGWSPTGSLYIGRGTQSFEGPINYTALTVFPTYTAITLSSALQKDHLISDVVIDSQAQPDRVVNAGTIVKIPANNQNPEILYATLRDAVIPSGEDHIDGVEVLAVVAGSIGNAPINTITQFDVVPFTGAGVTNVSAFSNGKDIETDTELRNRIKSYAITLARGTAPSILESVIGVSDPDDSKQVASAILTEPIKVGDPSILYIDDGSGFEPSYAGQSVDKLLDNANGTEEFMQLANYPLPRPQVVNVADGPFVVVDGSFLRVEVDGKEETIFFTSTDFLNPSAAKIAEIIIAINRQSTTFKARFTNSSSNILIYPVAHDAETIRVSPIRSTDNTALYLNTLLKFPTDEFSYIALYQNSTRLHEKERGAELETVAFASWNITAAGDIIIAVDGTPAQDRTFALSDFPGAASFAALTLDDWITAFNLKFAGLTATATPSQTMVISSNKIGALSKIEVTGGTYLNKWFPNLALVSQGQSAQFELNRQTGNLRILTDIAVGDAISAGVEDAKGFAVSATTASGNYNVSSDGAGRPAEMVVVVDSGFCVQRALPLLVGATITISNPSGTTMRIMSSTLDAFAGLLPGDFIYIVSRTSSWVSSANTGLFKILRKGIHNTAGTDSYVEVENIGVVAEGPLTIQDSLDIKAFASDGYPQIWRGSYVGNPPAEPVDGIVTSLNTDLIGVKASIFKSNSIKITSTTETNGSIAIPIAVGNAALLFAETEAEQEGNPSHLANRVSDKTLVGLFKRTTPTNTNVWLGRHIYTDQKGSLTSSSAPDSPPFSGTYSEQVTATGMLTPANVSYDDILSFTRGNNRNQFRSVKAKIVTDQVGTQQGTARTIFDHIISDEYELVRPIQLSSEDSVVVVMDKDSTNKTIDIIMSRTGIVNSGSDGGTFLPTSTEFSANDYDNEPGIDFSSATVWSKLVNKTEFADYAMWMRAHNWYATGGVSGTGKMIVRAAQFGPNGEKIRFSIKHPSIPNQDSLTFYQNTPSYTNFSYVFGSGPARPTAISSGDTIGIKGPYPDDSTNFPNGASSSGNYFDYTFSAGNFAAVTVGDVVAINDGSGISTFNRGQFRVANKTGNTLRVWNANASTTSPGTPEVTTVTTIADVVGTPSIYTVDTVADVGGSLHQTYFIIYDHAGSVAVWYDVNNTGSAPPPHGANRAIKVATVVTGDSANDVASKTAILLALDNAFSIGVIGNQITITETENGPLAAGSAGTSGFTVGYAAGTADTTIDGTYFTIYDDDGSCAVWFDVGDDGTQEPFHGADRSIKVTGVNYGDSAATIAAAVVAAVNPDVKFIASNLSNVITITRAFDGNVPASSAGTSGFTVGDTDGSLATDELITNEQAISVFPLAGTLLTDICSRINESDLMVAVPLSGTNISKATIEDDYSYSGDSTALAYGHNPTSSTLRDHVSLYDGVNFCKVFSNSNPNFTFKSAFTLQGVAPSVYSMNTTPNPGIADLGELFKLIPITVQNIYHQLTQKALSQLPIVANVLISNDRKNVQITSKNLGSEGAVEVIGGSANKAQAYLTGESEIATDTSGNYLLVKIPAFPDTFNDTDYVKLQNDSGVKRLSRLISTDSIDVTNPSTNLIEYNYNPKATNFISSTSFTITDVSASYGRPSGVVWRWTHGGGGATLAQVREGDLVFAFGTLSGWDQGNKVGPAGDEIFTGFPVIFVNDSSNYFDVVNPHGKAMSSTTIGLSSTVQICPAPTLKWSLMHAARVKVNTIVRSGSTVTVTCLSSHFLNTGDSVDILDSDNIPDATYSGVTVTSANVFTFTLAGSPFSETTVGASIIKTGLVPTRYRLEKLGFNGMVRLSRQDGESPRFTDCGVAVDDYLVISGSTFKSNNNGRFRVLAVDNNAIVLINTEATDELNTIRPFNNKSLQATWVSNTNVVTGAAGTFKNLQLGDWIKKPEDPDTFYRQVTSFSPSTPALATSIGIGNNYSGASAIAPGIFYDQLNDYDKGIELQSADDIAVFEGDSVISGDTLFVQNIVNSNWFSIGNVGSFEITEVGVNATTFKPFLRVNNPSGAAETNRLISVNTEGFYTIESLANKFYTIRQIQHSVLDDLNAERRSLFLTPSNRSYKFSNANATSVTHMGKFGYNTDVTTGVDGYLYYTGLLRRVQRIVDGYEPDADNFPGRRAVGGAIESLPPLNQRIIVAINVTTNEGVNLGDISNNIKSVIINYIADLGVGEDVILSEIIASVMQIKGVAAVTFTTPVPSTERITIADNEKATIVPEDIGIA